MTNPKNKAGTVPRTRARKLLRLAEHVLAVIGLCFVVYHLCFELTVMTSESMAPTLKGTNYESGDRILIEKVSGWFRSPRRWEIYSFYEPDGTLVSKRIVGLPGEKVSIKDHAIVINGVEIPRPKSLGFLKYYAMGDLAPGRQADCGKGYYMLGDDSIDSQDSRYIGPVLAESFRGRAWLILAPRSRSGFIQ